MNLSYMMLNNVRRYTIINVDIYFTEVATKSDPFEDLCDLFKNQAFSPTTPIINSSLFTKVSTKKNINFFS